MTTSQIKRILGNACCVSLLFTSLGIGGCKEETTIVPAEGQSDVNTVDRAVSYSLVWSDEFNTNGQPNANLWSLDIWEPKRVNNELQAYTNRSENVRVENGNLVIEARRDWNNGHEYTSARLNSKVGWTYGRMEARMKLPTGWGTWPAFWLYPVNESIYGWNNETNYWWPNCGEIDIMEHVGYEQNRVHASVHSRDYYFKKNTQRTGAINVNNTAGEYHVYAAEWFPDRIDFYVDNTKFYTVTNDNTGWGSWPFNHDFRIILNLAVGGDWGGQQGVDPNIWPKKLEIDYVRVYKLSGSAAPIGRTITLKGNNNQFVSGGNGQGSVWCNRASAGDWEKFTVVDAGNGKVALRSMGKYLSSENGQGAVTCNRTSIGDWEKFTWETLSDGKIALKGSNGNYLSSENGQIGMTCQRSAAQAWESFVFN